MLSRYTTCKFKIEANEIGGKKLKACDLIEAAGSSTTVLRGLQSTVITIDLISSKSSSCTKI